MNPTRALALLVVVLTVKTVDGEDQRTKALRLQPATDRDLQEIKASHLESLTIVDGRALTEVGWQAVGKMEQLTTLHLDWTSITDQDLSHFANLNQLESLTIRRSPLVTEEGLRHVQNLTELAHSSTRGP